MARVSQRSNFRVEGTFQVQATSTAEIWTEKAGNGVLQAEAFRQADETRTFCRLEPTRAANA